MFRNAIKPLARSALKTLGIPIVKDRDFENLFLKIAGPVAGENARIREIMDNLSDEEVMFQKGEGKEFCWPDGDRGPRHAMIFLSKYFIARRVDLILSGAPDLAQSSLLDIGATSDVIFRHIGKKELGLNISAQAVDYMKRQGIDAVTGSADALQFEDNSFDYLLSFQTIEHLDNPIKALREFKRVTRKKIFVTIPFSRQTRICPFEPGDRGEHRWHVFEFSPQHFEAVLNRVGLEILRKETITPAPFCAPSGLKETLFLKAWEQDSYLTGYSYYELSPND